MESESRDMTASPEPTAYSDHALGLKCRLAELARIIPKQQPVYYFGYAVHWNIGDVLIQYATEKFLRDHGYDVRKWVSHQNLTRNSLDSIDDDGTLIFQGGGNFGDLYKTYQDLRLRVLAAKPNVRSVILPQTIYFKDPCAAKATEAVFRRCTDLHLVARDGVSFDYARKNFSAVIHCLPDMVHHLFPADAFGKHGQDDQPLYFVRRDHYHGQDQAPPIRRLLNGATAHDFVDWPDFHTRADKQVFRAASWMHRVDRRLGNRLPVYAAWTLHRNNLVQRALKLFAAHNRLITNRLHGVLLGILSGHDISVFDTQYGKLTAYHDSWLSDFPALELVGERIHESHMV